MIGSKRKYLRDLPAGRIWRLATLAFACCLGLLIYALVWRPAQGAPAATIINSDITQNTTWTKVGSPYLVTKEVLWVMPGVTLTVQPGVEVVASNGVWLYVKGGLVAQGSAAEPIIFTGATKQAGAWDGITLDGDNSQPARGTFDHVIIEYGGQPGNGSGLDGNLVVDGAAATVTNSILRNGARHGLVVRNGGSQGYSLRVDGVAISNHLASAILCDHSSDPVLANLTFSGNGLNGVEVRGNLWGDDHLWEDVGAPYFVTSLVSGIGYDSSLTIEPGVEVRFGQGTRFDVLGDLFAVGTPDRPIVFTGAQPQPGWWGGLFHTVGGEEINFMELGYCDIGFGGNSGRPMLELAASSAFIHHCRLHDSADAAIEIRNWWEQPSITYNRIENNAFGVSYRSRFGIVDARRNWWGHASGPTHASNPGGSGDEVSDRVMFDPWLHSAEEAQQASGLVVSLTGPVRFVPGGVEQYQVVYSNLTGQALTNPVLRLALPSPAAYVDSTGGGVFWLHRHEVFWKLGTLAPGQSGAVAVRVRFDWGLAIGLKSTAVAQLSAAFLPQPAFDVSPYLTYEPRLLLAETELSPAQVQAERTAYAEVDRQYAGAIASGYVLGHASRGSFAGGDVAQIILLRFQPQFSAVLIWRQGETVIAAEVDGSSFTVYRGGLALRYDQQSGDWRQLALGALGAGISYQECMRQCLLEKLPGKLISQFIKGISIVKRGIGCVKALTGDDEGVLECAKQFKKVVPGFDIAVDLGLCQSDCERCTGDCDDARCHCCTEDKLFCDNDDWLYGPLGIGVKKRLPCNLDSGRYLAEQVEVVCALCQKCVDGPDGPACVDKAGTAVDVQTQASAGAARLQLATIDTDISCDECSRGKDPNELFGPAGDLLPGQVVSYTITYENEGEGDAFDVFVVDKLSESFDLATLKVGANASVSANSRTIFWGVGDLTPKGQPGSTGVITFTVELKPGLPSGLPISNQAVVHFPSVPEETPTNTVVNVIQPLVALPQEMEALPGQPTPILLQGRDVSGTPLTFAVSEAPLYGVLSGTPPALTYTPGEDWIGLDRITFTISNGVSTSRPAEVSIRVRPDGSDTTPPAILWTAPAAGGRLAIGAPTPIPGEGGPYYAPPIQVQFSEALDAASITTATIQLRTIGGYFLDIQPRYDGVLDQVVILLREPLQAGNRYFIVIGTEIRDLSGNHPLAAASASFEAVSVRPPVFLPRIRR